MMMGNRGEIELGGGTFLLHDVTFQEIFTPEDFTDIHRDISKAVEDFVKGDIISLGDDVENVNNEISRELMKKAGELGFLGIDIPEKYGGMELDKISSAIVSEKFGYGAGSFAVTELNHSGIGTLPLVFFGTNEQKARYLPKLASGEYIGAFALTEPNAGSDALNSTAMATLSEDGQYYHLNGNKQFITNAGFADIIFTYAKVNGKLFTGFIVEQNWEGVSVDEEEDKMGMKGTSTRAYHFENVKVPAKNVLGEVGKGHVVALNALNTGRFKVGAICVGSAKRSLSEAIKYSKQRIQFGSPICQFGLIKEKIGKMAIQLFAAESMLYRTAGQIQSQLNNIDMGSDDAGIRTAEVFEDYLIECSINKIYGSETEDYIVDEEVQIFGGYGYIHGNHPELSYRNARINRIWEGTNEINRIVIGNTLIRRIAQGTFDMMTAFERVSHKLDKMESIVSDSPGLDSQKKLVELSKNITLFIIGTVFHKYGQNLRKEQEILGVLSNMIIEIYAMETCLLRSLKILNRKNPENAAIPIKMAKVLIHDFFEKIVSWARVILEATEDGKTLQKYLLSLERLAFSPPLNTIALRRDIADKMIQYGGYNVP
jgi:alkylation response protein AidB-like acyl-CoA dehydrogenase